MNRLMMHFPLMDEAGGEGGGGTPTETTTTQTAGEGGTSSPAAAPANGGTSGGEGGSAFTQQTQEQKTGEGGEGGEGGSAFTQQTQTTQKPNEGGEGGEGGEQTPKDPTAQEILAMTDEDWALKALPDVDGKANPDRAFVTELAKAAREAGVSPRQMGIIQNRFNEVIKDRLDKMNAQEAKEQAEAAKKARTEAIAAFDDSGWADIRAAGAKYIPAGSELAREMNGPLGSNKQMLTILKVLGESLRGDAPPSTGASGSGMSLEDRLYRKLVPTDLR